MPYLNPSEQAENDLLCELTRGQGRRRVETRSMQQLRDERGNKCRRCESTVKLEFAHVKETGVSGRGRGQMVRYCDIKRNPDAYELLCWECHKEFDRKGGYNVFYGLLLVEWLNEGKR